MTDSPRKGRMLIFPSIEESAGIHFKLSLSLDSLSVLCVMLSETHGLHGHEEKVGT